LPPLHLLSYSTLLGTSLYQSFILTKLSYQSLPRPAFISLQKRVFPVYFRLQTGLLILCAITVPPLGLFSLVRSKSMWDGVLFGIAGVTAVLNLGVYEGRTRRGMVERVEQAKRDKIQQDSAAGSGYSATEGADSEGPSDQMRRLNRVFSKNHAMCIHLNLITMGAMLVYGWRLASKM
ncbi:hypothetical protein B0T14DRAFT_391109, partial [Immersiella caudata]